MNRRSFITLAVVFGLLLLGLVGFYLYLTGAFDGSGVAEQEAPEGIVHVRSIYFDGEGRNLHLPVGLGAAPDGTFAVTLRESSKVVIFDRDGDWIRTFGEEGLEAGQMMVPLGVALDPASNHVYVTDRSRLRLITYSLEGEFLWELPVLNPTSPVVTDEGFVVLTFGPLSSYTANGELITESGSRGFEPGQFDYPRAAAALDDGSLVVADSNNTRVQRITMSSTATATAQWVYGTPPKQQDDPNTVFGLPSGIAVDEDGHAFVLDGFRGEISVVDVETGEEIHRFKDLEGSGDGRFKLPTSITYLGDQTFAVTDTYNDRVQILRLLLPEDDSIISRNPQLLWLASLLLLPLLLLFGRKRWYATDATMTRVVEEGRVRLLLSVCRKVRTTPEIGARYRDLVDGDVTVADYLIAVGEEGEPATADDRLLAARPTGVARILLPRVRIVCSTTEQFDALQGKGHRVVLLEELLEGYELIEGDVKAGQ